MSRRVLPHRPEPDLETASLASIIGADTQEDDYEQPFFIGALA